MNEKYDPFEFINSFFSGGFPENEIQNKNTLLTKQSVFTFGGHEGRVLILDGQPHFVAKDLATWLEYDQNSIAHISNLTRRIPDEWKDTKPITTPGGIQKMITLTLEGANFFVLRSDKPKAVPLQKFLAGEVLPSIQKSGSYLGEGTVTVKAAELTEMQSLLARAEKSLRFLTYEKDRLSHENQLYRRLEKAEERISKKGRPLSAKEKETVETLMDSRHPADIARFLNRDSDYAVRSYIKKLQGGKA